VKKLNELEASIYSAINEEINTSVFNSAWLAKKIELLHNPSLGTETLTLIDVLERYKEELKTKINPKTKRPIQHHRKTSHVGLENNHQKSIPHYIRSTPAIGFSSTLSTYLAKSQKRCSTVACKILRLFGKVAVDGVLSTQLSKAGSPHCRMSWPSRRSWQNES
jgi:hypothetical protein